MPPRAALGLDRVQDPVGTADEFQAELKYLSAAQRFVKRGQMSENISSDLRSAET